MSLPSGYRRVEYIRSAGSGYIDTKYVPNTNTRVVCDFQAETLASGGSFPFGSWKSQSSDGFDVALTSGAQVFYNYGTTYKFASYSNVYERMTVDANRTTAVFTGSQTVSVALSAVTFTGTQNLYLLNANNNGTPYTGANAWNGKIYSCQIYDNGTLVRDFIPCINPSGVVGLYDMVNAKFYGNSGTGVFTAGRKVYKESEVAKLEYIESNGSQKINTGVYVTNATIAKLTFTPSTQYNSVIFGAAWSNFCFLSWSSNFFWMSGGADYSSPNTLLTTDINEVECGYNYCIVNGARHDTGANGSNAADVPICIFDTYEATGYPSTMKLFAFQLYTGDAIQRDYYPAEIDGEIGLWDALSGVLYTDAAGGTFIAGPYLAVDTPTEFEQVMAVYLKWAAVDCQGYKVYRNGSLLGTTANTYFVDLTADMNETYTYTLIAYRGETESDPAELTVYTRSGYFVIKPLIQSAFFQ